jgi:two-component system chemotaxis response regulator CheB
MRAEHGALRPLRIFGVVSGHDALASLAGLARSLPAGFLGAVLLVQHMPAERYDELVAWLQRRTRLAVRTPVHGAAARTGHLYVAPPDLHLALAPGARLRLVDGPPEHELRPAGDVLLRSVALACGAGGAAALLGDTGLDGTAGLAAVRAAGGSGLLLAGQSPQVVRLRRTRAVRRGPLEVLDGAEALGARFAELAVLPGAPHAASTRDNRSYERSSEGT